MIAGPRHVAPHRARQVTVHVFNDQRRWASQRVVLSYDGKPTPFPATVHARHATIRGVGLRLAEIWRETA